MMVPTASCLLSGPSHATTRLPATSTRSGEITQSIHARVKVPYPFPERGDARIRGARRRRFSLAGRLSLVESAAILCWDGLGGLRSSAVISM
jgi:hypothetical protein